MNPFRFLPVLLVALLLFQSQANAFQVVLKSSNLIVSPWYPEVTTVPLYSNNNQASNSFVVISEVVGYTNQSIYVMDIGSDTTSIGYTPAGSKMVLYYLPFNQSGTGIPTFTFYPANSPYEIPSSYLRKPGLYMVSGPLLTSFGTITQSTQWISLYSKNQLPAALVNLSLSAPSFNYSNISRIYNASLALNNSITQMQKRLAQANSSIEALDAQIAKDNATINAKTQQLLALALNDKIAIWISLGVLIIVLIILILLYLKRRREEEEESWMDDGYGSKPKGSRGDVGYDNYKEKSQGTEEPVAERNESKSIEYPETGTEHEEDGGLESLGESSSVDNEENSNTNLGTANSEGQTDREFAEGLFGDDQSYAERESDNSSVSGEAVEKVEEESEADLKANAEEETEGEKNEEDGEMADNEEGDSIEKQKKNGKMTTRRKGPKKN